MTFRELILKIRADQKLSQREFAAKIGVSRSTIARWESGKVKPVTMRVEEIEALFSLSPTDFT